jgi:hypothetical protein
LNYELAKQEHTQLWKQWPKKNKKIKQQNKFLKQECNKIQKCKTKMWWSFKKLVKL